MDAVLDWARVVVATLARALVTLALGLAFWAAAPAAIGWQPTTTMTGSMEPRITVGDVVVSRPVAATELRVGQVLLTDDPDHPERLRFHRYAEPAGDGTLVTKGDANPEADSSRVPADAVRGVGVLRVPLVGLPVTWLHEGRVLPLLLLAGSLVLLLALGTLDRGLRVAEEGAADALAGATTDPARTAPAGPRGRRRAPAAPATRRSTTARHRRLRRRRRAGVLAVVVGATSIGALLPAEAVAVPFRASTSATATFAAHTYPSPAGLVCTTTSTVLTSSATVSFSHPSTDVVRYELVSGGQVLPTTASSTSATTHALTYSGGGALVDLGTTLRVSVRAVYPHSWSSVSSGEVTVLRGALVLNGARCG